MLVDDPSIVERKKVNLMNRILVFAPERSEPRSQPLQGSFGEQKSEDRKQIKSTHYFTASV